MRLPIYLDNHATTPCDPRVVDAMLPCFSDTFGNAASGHSFGRGARAAVDTARGQIAALIHCSPEEIIFTSGATESNNLALKGVAEAYRDRGNHVITTRTEHKAVLDSCAYLETRGCRVTYLPVDGEGLIDPDDLRNALTDRTVLVSILFANNEIGVIQPMSELARIARERGVLFHTDAVQALGKIPLDVQAPGLDLVSLTAHKTYGPKGAGALYVRSPGVKIAGQMHGGGHERNMRSGTLNVPGIVGFGTACEIAGEEMSQESPRVAALRNGLLKGIQNGLPQVYLNGHPTQRLPGNLHLSFTGVEAGAILAGLDDVAISAGSACDSSAVRPSHVLKALGLPDNRAFSSIRFGIGRFNTEEEIDYAAGRVIETVRRLRELSPVWEG